MTSKQRTGITLLGFALLLVAPTKPVGASSITGTSFFDGLQDVVIIDFEIFPHTAEVIPEQTSFSDEWIELGVFFSSEGTTNTGIFDAPWRILGQQGINGAPTSGVRFASGIINQGTDTSDLRIDFTPPIDAFGFWLIDNDFTDVRIRALRVNDSLIETLVVPEVGEGGMSFRGIWNPGIAYVIIDGDNGVPLDSSFIDDLTFVVLLEPCPDIDGDLIVGVGDLLLLLAQWGPCTPICLGDINGDGFVNVPDLLQLLAAWGPCP